MNCNNPRCPSCRARDAQPAPSPPPEMPHGWHFSPATGGVFVSRREDGGQYALGITLMRALLATQGLHVIDAEQKAVLDACAAARLCDDDPDMCESEPLEPQEHGEDCYLYTDDQYAIAKAELARRAAKEGT